MMAANVWRIFQKLEHQKHALLSDLATWPETRLAYRPKPNAWSAANVLDHLIRVEQTMLEGVKTNLAAKRKLRARDHLGTVFIHCVMRSPIRFKVPRSTLTVLPNEFSDLTLLRAQWAATRWNLSALLQTLSAEQLHCAVFRYPAGGWMTMPQTMTFCSAHLAHHTSQFKRLHRASAHLH